MSLRVVVKSATDLPKLDRFSKSDPFCELTFNDERRTTKVISNDQNPEWNEAFKWTLEVVPESTEVIEVDVLDYESLEKFSALAKGAVPLASVLEQGTASLDVALTSPEGEPLESKLHVDLNYRVPLCEALRREVNAAKVRSEEQEELLRNLKATAAETEGELKRKNERLITENKGLNTTVARKDGELSDARDEIKRLKANISHLEAVTAAKGREIPEPASGESEDGELSRARERIEHLKAEVDHLQEVAAAKVLGSDSREPQEQRPPTEEGCCNLL